MERKQMESPPCRTQNALPTTQFPQRLGCSTAHVLGFSYSSYVEHLKRKQKKKEIFPCSWYQLGTFCENEIHFDKSNHKAPTVQQSLYTVGWIENRVPAFILNVADFHFSCHICLAIYIGSFLFFLC